MANPTSVLAQQLAETASFMELERTGRPPRSVTVVLSDDILVVTLHESMTPAERALAKTPVGAAQVQAFHKQLFTNTADPLRLEINRLSGREVSEATTDIAPSTESVVHAFTSGKMVQVFSLTTANYLDSGRQFCE